MADFDGGGNDGAKGTDRSGDCDERQRAPSRHGVALVLIDVINDMAFEGGVDLRRHAGVAVDSILRLREQADALDIPVVYVNDNGGHWRSERSKIIENALRDDTPARDFVERIVPRAEDYFVIKPHLSGFYATSLPMLLPKLGANRIVLTGVATDICVLFTAADAHMRDYGLWVPGDAVAAEHGAHSEWALEIMRKSMNAETRRTGDLSLEDWIAHAPNTQAHLVAERS